jgi:hypothetical protein
LSNPGKTVFGLSYGMLALIQGKAVTGNAEAIGDEGGYEGIQPGLAKIGRP